MHLQHVAERQLSTLTRRYPVLRHISLTVCAVILIWIYSIYHGERSVSADSVQSCEWSNWEHWPDGATPHHLVFVADPQIVDPHTYPGRPWPLSTLTERYTDQYMRRNFRLINEKLDPDSIVFLGDLFDGGREWATSRARPLKASQRKKLEAMGVRRPENEQEEEAGASAEGQAKQAGSEDAGESVGRRSLDSYKAALLRPHSHAITKEEHNVDKAGNDLKEFVHGENGRWSKWGPSQWDKEFDRFGKIFFDRDQLYPKSDRTALAAWDVPSDPTTVENGGGESEKEEYAIAGGKIRRLLSSLPGNHDLGFGPGVQLAVRDRFSTRFGEGNSVNVFGNHTFVSIDAPSLAAFSQFDVGGETPREVANGRKHLWQPTMDFLDNVNVTAARVVAKTITEIFPIFASVFSLPHTVFSPTEKDDFEPENWNNPEQFPVILLTHVPLYRDPNTDCGPFRERGNAISLSGGYQYQNTLTKGVSALVAQKVSTAGEIVHAFSGDDHDYCEVSHRYNVGGSAATSLRSVKEITVKTFSWAMGVRKPGFLLLSLWNPVNGAGKTIGTPLPTTQTHLCLLPDQLAIFISYARLAGLTLLVLLLRAVILSLRAQAFEPDTSDSDTDKPLLPRFLPHQQPISASSANGYSTPQKTKTRQRASSSGLNPSPSPHHNTPDQCQNLSVQRSYNARTRSVSPAAASPYNEPRPLIEKVGYYPQMRWEDPVEEVSEDEESRVGDSEGQTDSQAKIWKGRRRARGRARRVLDELIGSLSVVALVAGGYYVIMVRTG